MTDPNPTPNPAPKSSLTTSPDTPPTPLRCFTGALMAGGLGTAAYFLTHSIATTFANKPPTGNNFAVNISIAVRTLVVGTSTLATALFSITALGLIALGIQLLLKGQGEQVEE